MHLDFHWIPRVRNESFRDYRVYLMNRRCYRKIQFAASIYLRVISQDPANSIVQLW